MNLGPESGYGIQELDSPEVGVEFTNQIQRKVGGFMNKNPEVGCGIKEPKARAWSKFRNLTAQRLVVEFKN
jgi:hypothetical protein